MVSPIMKSDIVKPMPSEVNADNSPLRRLDPNTKAVRRRQMVSQFFNNTVNSLDLELARNQRICST